MLPHDFILKERSFPYEREYSDGVIQWTERIARVFNN